MIQKRNSLKGLEARARAEFKARKAAPRPPLGRGPDGLAGGGTCQQVPGVGGRGWPSELTSRLGADIWYNPGMDKARAEEPDIGTAVRRVRNLLQQSMLRDRAYVGRKLQALVDKSRRIRDPKTALEALNGLEKRLEASIREKEERIARCPALRYPRELPIVARRQDIVRAIRDHQVVIISGETGCGKSTQIPKMCLEAGRGATARSAVTQPRRIAAITIAHRIAEELGEPLGRSVGYKIRFQDRTSRDAYIKIMTDGMLLAETQGDPRPLRIRHDHHRRGPRAEPQHRFPARHRPDAPRRPARPQAHHHLGDARHGEVHARPSDDAPVIEVGGRMYPGRGRVPSAEDDASRQAEDTDYVEQAVKAVDRLRAARRPPGDILVFMPTEQDILETCEKLAGRKYAGTTILPLYARLPAGPAGPRLFRPRAQDRRGHERRRDLADHPRHPLRRRHRPRPHLPVPAGDAHQQPADQRRSPGRAPTSARAAAAASRKASASGSTRGGLRVAAEFTPPEILRSNLAEVILRMIDLRLGYPLDFPFVDMPHPRAVKDGFDTLVELGAITGKGRDFALTPLGRRMAPMPLDPADLPHAPRGGRGGLPARGRGHRLGPEHPRPPRAPARPDGGRPTRSTPSSSTPTRTSCRSSTSGTPTGRSTRRPARRTGSRSSAPRTSCPSRGCASGASSTTRSSPSSRSRRSRRAGGKSARCPRGSTRPSTGPSWADSCPISPCARRRASTRRPRAVRSWSSRDRPSSERRVRGSSRPTWSRRRGSTRARRRRSTRSGSRSSAEASAATPIPTRTGTRSAARSRPRKRSRLFGLEIVPAGTSPMAGSRRTRRTRSSSARPSSRATSTTRPPSSSITSSSRRRSRRSRKSSGGGTSASRRTTIARFYSSRLAGIHDLRTLERRSGSGAGTRS